MRIDWIALIVAIPLAYLATTIQFGGTHATQNGLENSSPMNTSASAKGSFSP